jgi:hypothetical protein
MVWVTPVYAGKILEVFKEAIPKGHYDCALVDPTNPGLLLRFVQSWSGRAEYLMWRSAIVGGPRASRTSMGRSKTLVAMRPSGVVVATTLLVHPTT